MRRRLLLAATILLIGCAAVQAQIVVFDPAITVRNTVTAVVKELLANLQEQQRRQIRRMSRRLSFFTDLQRYKLPEPPRWRIHIFNDPETVLFAGDYHAALNYGDASGNAFRSVSVPLIDARGLFGEEDPTAVREFAARLATINVADATAISATNDTGHVRYNGRREQAAIDQLDAAHRRPSTTGPSRTAGRHRGTAVGGQQALPRYRGVADEHATHDLAHRTPCQRGFRRWNR
jgi:hypothetical protein